MKLVILGVTIETPEPYSKGHVCSPAEAATLNSVLARGIAKGAHKVLKEKGEAELADFIEEFVKGFAEGHERLRAIEVEARRLARSKVEAGLYRSGKRLSEVTPGELNLMISKEAEKAEVMEEARRRIDTLRSIGGGLEELL